MLFKILISNYFIYIFFIIIYIINPVFANEWYGPKEGPIGQKYKNIIYIASDFQNKGVTSTYRSFQNASEKLKWNTTIVNGNGDIKQIRKEFFNAVKKHPDGIILGGFQADDFLVLLQRY